MPPPPAFESLFELHMARLWAVSLRLCGKREDAEDLMQEGAVIGFRSFAQFEMGTNFVAWMSMILVNVHRNSLRAKARRVTTISMDDSFGGEEAQDNLLYHNLQHQGKAMRRGEPEARLFEALDATIIASAFDSLPADFRECCLLFWVAELPYEEIARILNVPLGTVRSRLHRGRKLLQRALWSLAVERGIVNESPKTPGTLAVKENLLSWVLFLGALGAKTFR